MKLRIIRWTRLMIRSFIMDTRWIVELMILVLAFSVVMVVWPSMRRFLLGFFRNSAVGLILLWVVGNLLGIQVGLNYYTAAACGLLGLPGTALLIIIKGFIL